MRFLKTKLPGVHVIDLSFAGDSRGFFARLFCEEEFSNAGLNPEVAQINDSLSHKKYTLRGLHYQKSPQSESKIVRCISGSVYDVALDLRPDSPSFGEYHAEVLSSSSRRMLYIPRGCAHGYMTLEENTELLYISSTAYAPEFECGIRYNDPKFSIAWPAEPAQISDKDASWRDFNEAWHGIADFSGML